MKPSCAPRKPVQCHPWATVAGLAGRKRVEALDIYRVYWDSLICGWGAGSGEVGEWGRELAARVVLGQLPQSIRLGPHQCSSPSWVLTELPPGRLKKVVEVRAGSSTSSFYCRERHRVRGGQPKGLAAGAGGPSAFPGLEGRLGAFGEWQERCRETRLRD